VRNYSFKRWNFADFCARETRKEEKGDNVGVRLFLYFFLSFLTTNSRRRQFETQKSRANGILGNVLVEMPVVMATTVRRIKHEMKIRRSLSMTPSK